MSVFRKVNQSGSAPFLAKGSGPGGDLRSFAQIYRDFESHNIVFEVIEESAFAYFSNYHPRIKYSKNRMIARGDATCHEVFAYE